MRQRDGFTLIELMISIAIIAILLGLAVPGFQAFIQNTKIRTTADSIQAGLQLARSEALRRNARISFWLVSDLGATCTRSASGTSWVVSYDNPAGGCNASSSNTTSPRIIQSRSASDISSGVNVSALNGAAAAGAANCITFNGFGIVEPACTGGGSPISQIGIVSPTSSTTARRLQVNVSAGGAIRMCDPTLTSTTDPSYCGT